MKHSNRREFLQTSAVLLATAYTSSSFGLKRSGPLLSFSTLGCPDWTFRQMTDFAVRHGYNGIELRGIQRELDLTKCNEFKTPQSRTDTLRIMKEKGLKFVDLGASTNMHIANPAARKKNLDEARRFIDLAQQINCPYIRVFPNNLPKDQDKDETIDLIIKGLVELGDHAKGGNVIVLMESHGDLVKTDDLEKIMKEAGHPHVGMIWDIVNIWTETKESPVEAYNKLKKYIHHTHIKDAKIKDGKIEYTLLGKGEAPIFQAIDLLVKGGYKGYYSFEWEKLWHPEIAEPEIALADYAKAMKQHFK